MQRHLCTLPNLSLARASSRVMDGVALKNVALIVKKYVHILTMYVP